MILLDANYFYLLIFLIRTCVYLSVYRWPSVSIHLLIDLPFYLSFFMNTGIDFKWHLSVSPFIIYLSIFLSINIRHSLVGMHAFTFGMCLLGKYRLVIKWRKLDGRENNKGNIEHEKRWLEIGKVGLNLKCLT